MVLLSQLVRHTVGRSFVGQIYIVIASVANPPLGPELGLWLGGEYPIRSASHKALGWRGK